MPEPSKGGYMVYNTVGTRQASWFKSDKNGEISNYAEKGRGMNEGITTMYTNRELAKISQERALAAQRQQIYGHATDLCTALEGQVGEALHEGSLLWRQHEGAGRQGERTGRG